MHNFARGVSFCGENLFLLIAEKNAKITKKLEPTKI